MEITTKPAFAELLNVKITDVDKSSKGLNRVKSFLLQFGYLPDTASRAIVDSDRLDESTSEALKKYQARNGLPVSGVFDATTREQMTTHRCGMPDMRSGTDFSVRCSWKNPNLTLAFEDGTSDTSGEFNAVRRAFSTWASVTPLTFTEVARTQNPDVVIDWRPADDPDHSMVGGVLAHADFPPGCGVVTDELPKPVHFDDGEHDWSVGAQIGSFDVETVALHEIGHILGLQHSNVSGSVMFPSVSSNATNRALTSDDLSGIRTLYPPNELAQGTYTLRQQSSGRFLDAHESGNDFSVVTRSAQDNDTQRWILKPVGSVYTIRQKSSGRFTDAHESGNDFSVVSRTAQDYNTQRWAMLPVVGVSSTYTIQQVSNGRYWDAHESGSDFSVVTRTRQNNQTQQWITDPAGNGTATIKQRSSNRLVDAHESGSDFSIVTRTAQGNDTQKWSFGLLGKVYTLQQLSSNQFVDAHESGNDHSVVTRSEQQNASQYWVVLPSVDGTFTLQQLINGRFMDAHESGNDFSVVTRTDQNNTSQRWLIDPV